MAQSTLQIPENPDGIMIALQRYYHTKLHHWEMLLPDFSPELEEEEGGRGFWRGGGGWTWGGGSPYILSTLLRPWERGQGARLRCCCVGWRISPALSEHWLPV